MDVHIFRNKFEELSELKIIGATNVDFEKGFQKCIDVICNTIYVFCVYKKSFG